MFSCTQAVWGDADVYAAAEAGMLGKPPAQCMVLGPAGVRGADGAAAVGIAAAWGAEAGHTDSESTYMRQEGNSSMQGHQQCSAESVIRGAWHHGACMCSSCCNAAGAVPCHTKTNLPCMSNLTAAGAVGQCSGPCLAHCVCGTAGCA